MRIKKGFLEITETKREIEGPRANKAYPIPASTVIAFSGFISSHPYSPPPSLLALPHFGFSGLGWGVSYRNTNRVGSRRCPFIAQSVHCWFLGYKSKYFIFSFQFFQSCHSSRFIIIPFMYL